MADIGEIIGGIFAFIVGIYVLSLLAQAIPIEISGLQFGPMILGAFIVGGIIWFLKEVMNL